MFKRLLFGSILVFLLMGLYSPCFAYEVDLTVPLYGQEISYWSGPACAQMVMDAYPAPFPSIYYEQSVIWASILSHNSGEAGWATDPLGMHGALTELNPPQQGVWTVKVYDAKEDLMFQILYWMNRNSYPVTTLINRGLHWVDVVGYVTDIEPVYGSDPELLEITVNDPWPVGVGQVSTIDGPVWYDDQWEFPIDKAGTWYNKYAAVIEPPQIQGRVTARSVVRNGVTPVSRAEALQYSENARILLNLGTKHPSYAALNDGDTIYLEPILVREEPGLFTTVDEQVPYYYIIPYAAEEDNVLSAAAEIPGSDRSSISIVVNAFTGNFEQVSAFGKSIRYLPEDEAVKIAVDALKLGDAEIKSIEAEMVYTPGIISSSRANPFWKIAVTSEKNTVVYVDLEGKVYKQAALISQLYGR